jgi:putative ABC transport system permease protein
MNPDSDIIRQKSNPPNRALRFLRWFCREDYIEEIEGDLVELFEYQNEESPTKAKRKFTWNVIKYFRPAFIKSFKSSYQTNTAAMFRHNFLITFRNFNRYRSSFFINLTGLSVGLASVLLIYLWISDELSVDKFHEKDESLYQVMHNIPQSDGIYTCEYTPGLLAETIAEEFPEVEFATSVVPPSWFSSKGIISFDETRFKAAPQYIGEDYFNVFTCDFTKGSKNQLIQNKYAIAISDDLAMKLFKSKDNIIGKTIHWDNGNLSGDFNIVGVFASPPLNATEKFEILFNYEVFMEARPSLKKWGNSDPCTYFVLNKGSDINQFNGKITSLYESKVNETDHNLFIRKYSDQYLYNRFEDGKQAGGRIEYVRLFGVVAIFLLIIACVNFMNLATAKVSMRLKEIGVKKAFGVGRKALISQFLSESMLLTLISLLVAILLVILFLPQFNNITGKHLSLVFNKELLLALTAIVITTGLLSGSYPAFYLSAIKPIRILKGDSIKKRNSSLSELLTRRGLVVFQFSLSIIFIVAVLVVQHQMSYIQSKNLGYNKDNLLHFNLSFSEENRLVNNGRLASKIDAFLNEINDLSGVKTSFNYGHDLVGYHGVMSGVDWKEGDEDGQVNFRNLEMGYNFVDALEIKLIEGRSFSNSNTNETSKVLFNEKAIELMNLENPIGKVIKVWGREREIIGVVNNFHLESLHESIKPCVIQLEPRYRNIMVKVHAGKEQATIAALQSVYEEYCPGLPFEYEFVDQDFQRIYASEQKVGSLSKYFAGIAILISCLGLFGLTSFTAEQKTKEVGIRKVLGASALNVMVLICKDFVYLILISFLIASPIAWYLLNTWLKNFAYSIDIQWWTFGLTGLLVLLMSSITIGYKTFHAAKINPVDSLRNE